MQHLFSKISMWAALAASAVALSACGGGSGSGSSLNGPLIQVFPTEAFKCVAGQQCRYIVEGTGAPFYVKSTDGVTVPSQEVPSDGFINISSNVPSNGEVTLVFGASDCKTWACGAGRKVERKITFTSASSGSGGSGSQGGQTGPASQIPELLVSGTQQCAAQTGTTTPPDRCIGPDASGTLKFVFDTSKNQHPAQLLTVEYLGGDWKFGSSYAGGTQDDQKNVACKGGECSVDIATDVNSNGGGTVYITYVDPGTGYQVGQRFTFTIGAPAFVLDTSGAWGNTTDTSRVNCDTFFDSPNPGPGGFPSRIGFTTGGIAKVPNDQVTYTFFVVATPAPQQAGDDFTADVVDGGGSSLSLTVQSNPNGSFPSEPIYLVPTKTCTPTAELYANCAPKKGRIDITVDVSGNGHSGSWSESIYCQ